MKPILSLRQRALDLLSRREISRNELARKLSPHCEDADELKALLDELAQKHWQSDKRFTEAYIHSKSRHHGNRRLQQALATQGVDADTIREHLPDSRQQIENAVAIVRKKFKQAPSDSAEKYKQMRFLAYRGFEMDIIHTAISQAWENPEA